MMGRWLSAFVGLGMLTFGTITFVLGLILGHGTGGSFAVAETPAETATVETSAIESAAQAPETGSAEAGTAAAGSGAATKPTAGSGSRSVTVPADGTAAGSGAPAGGAAEPTEVAALPPPAEPAPEPPAVAQVRSGPSPQRPPSSKLRGPLLQAATAPPGEAVAEVPPPAPAEPAGPPSVLSVQVARFLMKENADALAAELTDLGYRPQIVLAREPGIPAAPSWYMVTLGPQPDAETANRLAREAAAALGLPAHAVSWPLATE